MCWGAPAARAVWQCVKTSSHTLFFPYLFGFTQSYLFPCRLPKCTVCPSKWWEMSEEWLVINACNFVCLCSFPFHFLFSLDCERLRQRTLSLNILTGFQFSWTVWIYLGCHFFFLPHLLSLYYYLFNEPQPCWTGPRCSSSQWSSWAQTSLTLPPGTGRSRPSPRWWAAWTGTPAATAPRSACRRRARRPPRSCSTARRSYRTWPTWCENYSSSSTNPLASSPRGSFTTEEEYQKDRWSRYCLMVSCLLGKRDSPLKIHVFMRIAFVKQFHWVFLGKHNVQLSCLITFLTKRHLYMEKNANNIICTEFSTLQWNLLLLGSLARTDSNPEGLY